MSTWDGTVVRSFSFLLPRLYLCTVWNRRSVRCSSETGCFSCSFQHFVAFFLLSSCIHIERTLAKLKNVSSTKHKHLVSVGVVVSTNDGNETSTEMNYRLSTHPTRRGLLVDVRSCLIRVGSTEWSTKGVSCFCLCSLQVSFILLLFLVYTFVLMTSFNVTSAVASHHVTFYGRDRA